LIISVLKNPAESTPAKLDPTFASLSGNPSPPSSTLFRSSREQISAAEKSRDGVNSPIRVKADTIVLQS
jgi:hypothetical protein